MACACSSSWRARSPPKPRRRARATARGLAPASAGLAPTPRRRDGRTRGVDPPHPRSRPARRAPLRARGRGVVAAEAHRHGLIEYAVHEQDRHRQRHLAQRVGGVVALGQALRRAAHQLPHGAAVPVLVSTGEVAHPGQRHSARDRHAGRGRRSPRARPRRAARDRPPTGPDDLQPSARADRPARGRAPGAALAGGRSRPPRRRTSAGQPPPLPTRRYSMFHTAKPRRTSSAATARITPLP